LSLNSKSLAAFFSSAPQDSTTFGCSHLAPKTMLSFSFQIAFRGKILFHNNASWVSEYYNIPAFIVKGNSHGKFYPND